MSTPTEQIAKQWDPITKEKALKGAFWAALGGLTAGLFVLAWRLGIEKATITAFIAWLVPAAAHAWVQYLSGSVFKQSSVKTE